MQCFDPEGAKTPKGERNLAAQLAKRAGTECNGLEAWMPPETGANQSLAGEPKSRTGRTNGKRVSEVTVRTIDLRAESAQAEGVLGEGKAATSERSRFGKISCGASKSDEAEAG
jgi:hypothetical protein